MGIHYSLHICRKDGKKIAETGADGIVKPIFDADDDFLPVGRRSAFGISRFYDVERQCEDKISEIEEEIKRLKDGVFKCRSVEVKNSIEEDVFYKKESLKEWRNAAKAAREGIGVIECLAENLIMPMPEPSEKVVQAVSVADAEDNRTPKTDREGDADDAGSMAYRYWAYKTGEKDAGGYDVLQYSWVDSVIIWIDDGYDH